MATITTTQKLDAAPRTAGEAHTVNGGTLVIDTDTRWHANAPAGMTGSLGSLTCSSTLGGGMWTDATKVREVWFSGGSGTVPAIGTTITQGAASGYLLGVWANQTSAPTAVGAAMPTTGFIKFREVTGAFAAGALTGITATATGADVISWLEIVADQSSNFTFSGLGIGKKNTGLNYFIGTTNGSAGQTFQVPTNGGGNNTHVPGILVETSLGSNIYEVWPCLANAACGWSSTTLATDARAKLAQSVGNGVVRIGSDGTNNVGYVPPVGCKVFVPNIFERQCLTTTRAVNELQHTTITSRPKLVTTSSGNVEITSTMSDWYYVLATPNKANFNTLLTADSISISNPAQSANLAYCGLGIINSATAAIIGFNITFSTISNFNNNSVAKRELNGAFYPISLNACVGVIGSNYAKNRAFNGLSGIRTAIIYSIAVVSSSKFTNFEIQGVGGFIYLSTNADSTFFLDYTDNAVGATITSVSQNGCLFTYNKNTIIKKFTFGIGGLITNAHPFGGVFSTTGNNNCWLRNAGEAILSASTTNAPSFMLASSFDNNLRLQRCTFNTRTGLISAPNSSKITIESCYTTITRQLNPAGKLAIIKGSQGLIPAAAVSGATGSNIVDYFQSSTTGAIVWFGNSSVAENAVNVQLTGTAAFTGGGSILMPTAGDTAIFIGTYYIKGHLSFDNIAPVLIGTNTGNFTIEYQIDINNDNGFNGAWKTLNTTNLTAETISPSAGFNLKIKLTTATSAIDNALAQIKISTVTSNTAQTTNLYPLDLATVTLTGLTSGSCVYILNTDDNIVLYNKVVNNTSLTYALEYVADKNVLIRIMYSDATSAKLLYSFNDVLTIDGISRLAQQIDDPIYPIAKAMSSLLTGVTIDDTTGIISINRAQVGTTGFSQISWQEAYVIETQWLATPTGLAHFPRVITAIDITNFSFSRSFKIKNIGSYPLKITSGYGFHEDTKKIEDIFDYSGGTIFAVPDHVVGYKIDAELTLAAIEASTVLAKAAAVAAIPTTTLTTAERDTLMALPTANTISNTVWSNVTRSLTDKANFGLSSTERELSAAVVEAHLLNEGDSQMLINAIVGAIGNQNVDQALLVAAIRADLERTGGKLVNIDTAVANVLTAVNMRPTTTLTTAEHEALLALPTAVAAIPTAPLLAINYVTPPTANTIADSVWAGTNRSLTDKNGFGLSATERELSAAVVEAHLLNEGDSQMLINAIVGAIGNQNVDQAALVAAIGTYLERTGGKLVNIDTAVANVLTAVNLRPTTTLTTAEHEALLVLPTAVAAIPTDTLLAIDYDPPNNTSIHEIKDVVVGIRSNTEKLSFDDNYNVWARVREVNEGVIPSAIDNANAVFNFIIENGKSFSHIFKRMKSVIYGKTQGVGTNSETFLSDDGINPMITTEFDVNNNRSNVNDHNA